MRSYGIGGDFAEDIGYPGGGTGEVIQQGSAIHRGQVAAQAGDDFIVHKPPADGAERQNGEGAGMVPGGNKARRDVFEHERARPSADAATGSRGEQHGTHGNLITQAQRVGRMGAGGVDPGAIPAANGIVKLGIGCDQIAKDRVLAKNVIQPATSAAQLAGLHVAGKRLVHGSAGAEIQKIRRRPDVVLRSRPDPVENGGVNGVGVFFHDGMRFRQKNTLFI